MRVSELIEKLQQFDSQDSVDIEFEDEIGINCIEAYDVIKYAPNSIKIVGG